MEPRDVVVVGGSAGSLEPLRATQRGDSRVTVVTHRVNVHE
jgi:pyruvate/2-oxoglutarate dehydrogenase complex dihydrolipoamide dehydrogenase (E3) component